MEQTAAHSFYPMPKSTMAARADGRDAAVAARADEHAAAVAARDGGLEAVVAPMDDGPAAAVAFPPHELAATHVNQPFRLNNAALKYIRDTHENPPGVPTTEYVYLTDAGPYQIGVISHPGGMDYSFTEEKEPWSWRQMLAGMTETAKTDILGDNPRLGVTRIVCAPTFGSYDHKRCHASKKGAGRRFGDGVRPLVWDFFVTRTDGTTKRLRTNWKGQRVEVTDVDNPPKLPDPPRRGMGRSDGPGTYTRITKGNYGAGPAHGGVAKDGGAGAAPKPHGGDGGVDADSHGRGFADNHGRGDCDDAASEAPTFGGESTAVWAPTGAVREESAGAAQASHGGSPPKNRWPRRSLASPPDGGVGPPNTHQGQWHNSGTSWSPFQPNANRQSAPSIQHDAEEQHGVTRRRFSQSI